MIVNVGFVDVGRNDESVFSLCPSHRCFIADLVRFFRGDFSRLKGLAYLVCDDIVLLLSAGNMLILPFGKQKFLICCLWITLIGTDKFAIIGFAAFVSSRFCLPNIERPSFPYSHGVQSILSLPFPSLPSQKEKATGR